MAHEIKVPDIGNYHDVPVIELLVKPGDTVKKDQGLITLESDKATMEVPSSVAGVVKELRVKLGDAVSEGAVIALVEAADAAVAPAPTKAAAAPTSAPAPAAPAPAPAAAPTVSAAPLAEARPGVDPEAAAPRTPPVPFDPSTVLPDKVPHASPAVRLFARELGVDLRALSGSGRKGRITREDVQNFVKAALAGGGAPRAAAAPGARAASRCCPGRRWISPSSARSSPDRSRASRRFPARTSRATG